MAELIENEVIESDQAIATALYNRSNYGTLKRNKLHLSLIEALFLLEKDKIEIKKGKKVLTSEEFIKKAKKNDKRFLIRYRVYSDLRGRGYVTKTALKYGADFRIYPRGKKMGEEHAKWAVFVVHESESFDWKKFASMMRVAHSVRKTLLIAVVDDELDTTYYESNWIKP